MVLVTLLAATSAVLAIFGGAMVGELRAAQRVINEQNELIKNQRIALSALRYTQQLHADGEHK